MKTFEKIFLFIALFISCFFISCGDEENPEENLIVPEHTNQNNANQHQAIFYPEGTKWQELVVLVKDGDEEVESKLIDCSIGEETSIDGKVYHKIIATPENDATKKYHSIFVREEGKQVFLTYDFSQEEHLLYNFDWKVGNVLQFPYANLDLGQESFTVKEGDVRNIQMCGKELDYLDIKFDAPSTIQETERMYYGIGFTHTKQLLDLYLSDELLSSIVRPHWEHRGTVRFWRDGKLVFEDMEKLKKYGQE